MHSQKNFKTGKRRFSYLLDRKSLSKRRKKYIQILSIFTKNIVDAETKLEHKNGMP